MIIVFFIFNYFHTLLSSAGINSSCFPTIWCPILKILVLYMSKAFPIYEISSKRIMRTTRVPLVPGHHGHEQDITVNNSEADNVPYSYNQPMNLEEATTLWNLIWESRLQFYILQKLLVKSNQVSKSALPE
ncbi:uncharacterized protein [Rutidosis leptorrhynchoides]|uniref:uncharacterized protein isoform X2 n=1 Tax=Rutidosis leptorrhynchoides TaxID=125765 RepID=UPI003A9912F0